MVERKNDIPDPDFEAITDLPTEHHADECDGLPIFHQDSGGQWTAFCDQDDNFEITGCETRREAGARFYGGQDATLYGAPTAPIVTVRFEDSGHSTTSLVSVDGTELFTLNPSTIRGDHHVHAKPRLPGGHAFSHDRGDKYGAGMDAAKRQAVTDLQDWFKLRFGLDVIVVETLEEA
jgi:hypothetical protein